MWILRETSRGTFKWERWKCWAVAHAWESAKRKVSPHRRRRDGGSIYMTKTCAELVKVLEVRWHQCFVRGLRRGHQVFLHPHVVNKALNTVLTTRDGSFGFALASGVRLQHTFLVSWVISRKKKFWDFIRERKRCDLISIFTPVILLFHNLSPLSSIHIYRG